MNIYNKQKKISDQEGIKTDDQKQYILLLDEMKVKTGLVFGKSTGELVGFSDLGSANNDIDNLMSSNPPLLPFLAKKMVAFMIRPVFKPSLSFPVASIFSYNRFERRSTIPHGMGSH